MSLLVWGMKNFRQIFLIIPILVLANPFFSYASESTVSVQSITNSSSNSNSVVAGNTHIRIETNGVVKECDTKNGDDCTHMESDDGSSTVNVNNNSSNKNTEIDDDKDDVLIPTPHASSAAKIALIEQKKIIKEQQHSFIEEIKVFFKSIFETLTLKF